MSPDAKAEMDADATEVLLYLYGELSQIASAEFEQRLVRSPELAERLAQQAQLINRLASCSFQPVANPDAVSVAIKTHRVHPGWWVALSVAASLMVVVGVSRYQTPEQPAEPEALQIAKAWINNEAIWTSAETETVLDDDDSFALGHSDTMSLHEESWVETDLNSDDLSCDDLVPSWMLVALDDSLADFPAEANDYE